VIDGRSYARTALADDVGNIEPVRIFVGEAVEQTLSTRLHKSLSEQDSKLVHC